ncbi:hypothetical protein J6590_001655 [Homalodisca vitripennis]|nr:hypothetical protein J6590_001655 [Homalodisca vitripennis]
MWISRVHSEIDSFDSETTHPHTTDICVPAAPESPCGFQEFTLRSIVLIQKSWSRIGHFKVKFQCRLPKVGEACVVVAVACRLNLCCVACLECHTRSLLLVKRFPWLKTSPAAGLQIASNCRFDKGGDGARRWRSERRNCQLFTSLPTTPTQQLVFEPQMKYRVLFGIKIISFTPHYFPPVLKELGPIDEKTVKRQGERQSTIWATGATNREGSSVKSVLRLRCYWLAQLA